MRGIALVIGLALALPTMTTAGRINPPSPRPHVCYADAARARLALERSAHCYRIYLAQQYIINNTVVVVVEAEKQCGCGCGSANCSCKKGKCNCDDGNGKSCNMKDKWCEKHMKEKGLSYAEAYELAIKTGKPLVVCVGCECCCACDDYICCCCDSLTGFSGKLVIVAADRGQGLKVVAELKAGATAEEVKSALKPKKQSQQFHSCSPRG
jgi:hypothetical protein